MKNNIFDKLKEIEEQELIAATAYPSDKSTSLENRIKHYQWIDKKGEYNLFGQIVDRRYNRITKSWGNLPANMNVVKQLFIDPHIIIDLKPFRNLYDFIMYYGVTPKQLSVLAQDGLVAFNLYSLNKGLNGNYEKNDFEPYLEACRLVPDFSELFYTEACRMNTVRKASFFNEILEDQGVTFQELEENAIKIFYDKFKILTSNDLKSIRYPEHEYKPALVVAAHHYAFNQAVIIAEGNNLMHDAHNLVIGNLQNSTTKDALLENIKLLRGLKNAIASKFTSSMGGIYNMSQGDFDDYSLTQIPYSPANRIHSEDRNLITAIQEFIEEQHLKEQIEEAQSLQINNKFFSKFYTNKTLPVLSDIEFNTIRAFLLEHKSLTTRSSELFESISSEKDLTNKIKYGKDIIELQKDMIKEATKQKFIEKFFNTFSIYSPIPAMIAALPATEEYKRIAILISLVLSGGISFYKANKTTPNEAESVLINSKLRIYRSIENLKNLKKSIV